MVYIITSDNEDGGEVLETPMPSEESALLTSSINPGVTITYTITLKFKETGSNQDENQGADFSGKLQIFPSYVPYLESITGLPPEIIFNKKVLYYSGSVSARTSTVSLTPTAEHENIIIKINDEVVESGKQYRVDLNSGLNRILIVTTSIIDNSQLTYVIEVTRG